MHMKNLEQYKDDLGQLIAAGERLEMAMHYACEPKAFEERVRKEFGEKATPDLLGDLPSFLNEYQAWYSEAKALVRQLLPDRFDDFSGYYEKPKQRKAMTYETYRISDCLLGLEASRNGKVTADPSAAISHFQQQLAIVKAVRKRFESSLFEIRQLVQVDLFDSELEAAKDLVKHGFLRAAARWQG